VQPPANPPTRPDAPTTRADTPPSHPGESKDDRISPNTLILVPPVSSSYCTVIDALVRSGEKGREKGEEVGKEGGVEMDTKGGRGGRMRVLERGVERRLERVPQPDGPTNLPHTHRFLPHHLSEEEASHGFYGQQLEGVLAR
jgi:hypothetical protein